MTRTIATLLAAATIVGVAAPVAAQTKYYARERISGIARITTYVPTYSQTYTACSGGRQTASLISCATSDGTAAKLADCASSPKTISRTCTMPTVTCPEPVSGNWWGNGNQVYNLGTTTTAAQARALCEAHVKGTDKPGVCFWNSYVVSNPGVSGPVTFYQGATLSPGAPSADYNASYCPLG